MKYDDDFFMEEALKQARIAFEQDEVPVGCVIVVEQKIVARAYNQVELLKDPTAHAEILAMTSAFQRFGAKYLPQATLYVTLEPCVMCSGAMYWGKIGRIVYGADDEKNGYRHHPGLWPFHPKAEVVRGVMAEECAMMMRSFFNHKR